MKAVARGALWVLATDAAFLALVGAFGWWRGWSTRAQWGEGLVTVALGALALGALSAMGSLSSRSTTLGFAATAGRVSQSDRVLQAGKDAMRAHRFLLGVVAAAAPLVVAGVWIDPRV